MFVDQDFYDVCFKFFLSFGYGQRPKFAMVEPSATAEGENCAYGPTLDFFNEFFLVSQVDKMFTSFLTLEMT